MDTFMDQLAEKTNAQQMITANTNAELEKQQKALHGYLVGQLDEIRQAVSREDATKSLEEKIASANEELRDGYHKECVKVYRNVQASFTEENEKQTHVLMERVEDLEKKLQLILVIAGIALATGVVSLVIQLLSVFKVLP